LFLFLGVNAFPAGSYQPLQAAELPDKFSPDYNPTLLFKARGLVTSDPDGALALLPAEDVSLPAKSVRSLAAYYNAKKAGDDESKEKALDELRDLCIEIEGEDVEEDVKGLVRCTAAVAFVQEGENEEALETLEAGTSTHNLEG
jgi:coatomer subunit epsilon